MARQRYLPPTGWLYVETGKLPLPVPIHVPTDRSGRHRRGRQFLEVEGMADRVEVCRVYSSDVNA